MEILSVVGARPNFMKIAPIISAIKAYNHKTANSINSINHILVHTGQHYDETMSDAFFKNLNLPKPDICLNVGSASHAAQTAEIMKRFEEVLLEKMPDVVLVVGDVNSTLACALVASKIEYPAQNLRRKPLVSHIEAGLRSFDRFMPEEINRVLTDHISDLLFVTEESAIINLKNEGISEEKIFFVGNTMIDTLLKHKQKAQESDILDKLLLIRNPRSEIRNSAIPYGLLTLHRPSNVDDKETFLNVIEALREISKYIPIIFPAHPRTQSCIKKFGFQNHFINPLTKGYRLTTKSRGIHCVEPLGYLDFLCLMSNAKVVLTDSGGIQEETTCLGIPCITIRENTERPVTVKEGTNIIAGTSKENIVSTFKSQIKRKHKGQRPKLWDGMAAKRILKVIINEALAKGSDKFDISR